MSIRTTYSCCRERAGGAGDTGARSDLSLRPGLPLKILRRFAPSHDAVLGAGRHALSAARTMRTTASRSNACTTYSIGFRARRAHRARDSSSSTISATAWSFRAATPIPICSADGRARADRRGHAAMRGPHACRRSLGRATPSRVSSAPCCRSRSPTSPSTRPAAAVEAAFAPRCARAACASTCARNCSTMSALYINGDVAVASRPAGRRCIELANARKLAGVDARRRLAVASSHSCNDWYRHGYLHSEPADAARRPAAAEEVLDTVAAQVAAIDELDRPRAATIRVFDVGLVARWAGTIGAARRARSAFLRRIARRRRIEIIVHDTRWLEASCSRLTTLLRTFARHHDLSDRSRGAERDGPAADRRRAPLPASVSHRAAARDARNRGAAARAAARSSDSTRSGPPANRDLTATVLGI